MSSLAVLAAARFLKERRVPRRCWRCRQSTSWPTETGADLSTRSIFSPIPLDSGVEVVVSPGYRVQKFLRWGEPILRGAPEFDFHSQSALAQAQQFGYNCDFLQYFPLGHDRGSHGLLSVNHEYTNPELMFPGFVAGSSSTPATTSPENVAIELAAHGLSVVEVRLDRRRHQWKLVRGAFNRRITGETEIELTGPAAGDPRLVTFYDSTGTRVRGMLNNCGGGITPWGTLLTAEENFNQYFAHRNGMAAGPIRDVHARYGLTAGNSERGWEIHEPRFDLRFEPNEPFRFGFIVEVDPYDADCVPKKRTALGRLKHEAATCVVSKGGHLVAYTGDDERFEHMYKFISRRRVSHHRARNFDLLDEGVLYAARFNDDGTGEWLPLLPGEGQLASWLMSDVLLNTREAARLMGATRMDRPEDLQVNPENGKLYCAMTNNTQRTATGANAVDAANPRPNNRHGHVIELTERRNDPGARPSPGRSSCCVAIPQTRQTSRRISPGSTSRRSARCRARTTSRSTGAATCGLRPMARSARSTRTTASLPCPRQADTGVTCGSSSVAYLEASAPAWR
jgi:secreted PhoX family phosphatase